jgi:hypothetical protein
MYLCPQLQKAATAWTAGDWQMASDELRKAPYEAAVSVPVRFRPPLALTRDLR